MGNILDKIKKGADRVNDFTGKVTDVLGFFGADVLGLIEGRKFPYRNHFHDVLNMWDASIPNRNLWIVYIEKFPIALVTEVGGRSLVNKLDLQGTGLGGGNPVKWKSAKNNKTLQRYEFQRSPAGCTFAQGVVLPTEGYNVQTISPKNHRGLIPGLIAGTRADFVPLRIQFRETNTSFVDNIVRPWVILGSHYGFVARGPDDVKNIKSTIHVYQLGKTLAQTSNVHRKVFSFYNCVPTTVSSAELTYDVDTQMDMFDTSWAYTHYATEQLPDLPLQLVIDQIMGGGLMGVINKVTKGKVGRAIKKITSPIDSIKKAGKVLKGLGGKR